MKDLHRAKDRDPVPDRDKDRDLDLIIIIIGQDPDQTTRLLKNQEQRSHLLTYLTSTNIQNWKIKMTITITRAKIQVLIVPSKRRELLKLVMISLFLII